MYIICYINDMAKHIFFTGPKQVGKSTIIQKYISAHAVSCAGFLTVKSNSVFPGTMSVHMLDIQKDMTPSKENFLFFCGQAPDALYYEYGLSPDPMPRFDRIGCDLLNTIPSDTDLIIMDEIGPHEYGARDFCASVFRCLDGQTPILGVLQQTDSDLFHKIADHSNVNLIRVSKDNRDHLLTDMTLYTV